MDNLIVFIAGIFVGGIAFMCIMSMMQASGREDNRIENWERRKTVPKNEGSR